MQPSLNAFPLHLLISIFFIEYEVMKCFENEVILCLKPKLSVGCGRSLNEWVIQSFIQTIHPNGWFIWSLNHSLKWFVQNVDLLSNEAQQCFSCRNITVSFGHFWDSFEEVYIIHWVIFLFITVKMVWINLYCIIRYGNKCFDLIK